MAKMVNMQDAMGSLGCDEATLQSYINNGQIRASETDGVIALHEDDVRSIAAGSSDSDDGTIILSDSEDLSIDLGDVIDDSAVTMMQNDDSGSDDDSITFAESENLDLMEFDDANTVEIEDTGVTEELSFTESNTGAVTGFDETMIDATVEATVEATAADLDAIDADIASVGSAKPTVRKSVQSRQVYHVEAEETVHPVFSAIAVCSIIVMLLISVVFAGALLVADGEFYEQDGSQKFGNNKHMMVNLCESIAGFSATPNKKHWDVKHKNESDNPFVPMEKSEGGFMGLSEGIGAGATWRYKEFLGKRSDDEDLTELEFMKQMNVRIQRNIITDPENEDSAKNAIENADSEIIEAGWVSMDPESGNELSRYESKKVENKEGDLELEIVEVKAE